MTSVITLPLAPTLQIGPVPIHWYGLGYAIAFLVGARLVTPFLERRGISRKTISDAIWWNIGIGLVGARLYFVLQQPDLSAYIRNPIRIIAVWEGGMAFFGAIFACLTTVVVICYVKKLPLWVAFDAIAIFATLPQAIGRIGNVINGDILGSPSNLPWAVRYTSPFTFAPHVGVAYQPAGAYELLVSLALFGLVMLVLSRRPPDGVTWIIYLASYAVSQLLLFFVRATEPVLFLGLKQAQITALAILLLLVPALVMLRQRYPRIFTVEEPVEQPEKRTSSPPRERPRPGVAEETT